MLLSIIFCLFFSQAPSINSFEASNIQLRSNLLRAGPGESVQTETPDSKPTKRKSEKSTKPTDFSRLDFRVGKIISIQDIVTAPQYYVEEIDVGEPATRTVVNALVDFIPLEHLEHQAVVILCNRGVRKIAGYETHGLLLCSNSTNKIAVLEPPFDSSPGDQIVVEGYDGRPDRILKVKEKVLDTVLSDMEVNEEKVVTYKGVPLRVKNKGFITAEPSTTIGVV